MLKFRLDRFLTLYFFYPLITIIRRTEVHRLPILMYHSVSADKENNIHAYYDINTAPIIFEQQMKFLHENNYTAISMIDLKEYLDNRKILPNKHVVITFDDGYRDFYTEAFPILQKYNYTATVFLPSFFMDNIHSKLIRKEHLSWQEVKLLSDNGVSFGSHTMTHPRLSSLKVSEIEHELKQSKEIIQEKTGREVHTFSYPYRFPEVDESFLTLLRGLLQQCNYKLGVTTRVGTTSFTDDIYFLKRLPVNSHDDNPFFHSKLEGGYDWIHGVQYLFKISRRKMLRKWM